MVHQNVDKCLFHLSSAQSLIDLSLMAVDHPDKSVNLQSLGQCLSLCQSYLIETRLLLQNSNTPIVINTSVAGYEQ